MSTSYAEPFSRSVVEAAYAGCTLVLPRADGFREMFTAQEVLWYEHTPTNSDLVRVLRTALTTTTERPRVDAAQLRLIHSWPGVARKLASILWEAYIEKVNGAALSRSTKIEALATFVRSQPSGCTPEEVLKYLNWSAADWWAQYHFGLRYRGFQFDGSRYYYTDSRESCSADHNS